MANQVWITEEVCFNPSTLYDFFLWLRDHNFQCLLLFWSVVQEIYLWLWFWYCCFLLVQLLRIFVAGREDFCSHLNQGLLYQSVFSTNLFFNCLSDHLFLNLKIVFFVLFSVNLNKYFYMNSSFFEILIGLYTTYLWGFSIISTGFPKMKFILDFFSFSLRGVRVLFPPGCV